MKIKPEIIGGIVLLELLLLFKYSVSKNAGWLSLGNTNLWIMFLVAPIFSFAFLWVITFNIGEEENEQS